MDELDVAQVVHLDVPLKALGVVTHRLESEDPAAAIRQTREDGVEAHVGADVDHDVRLARQFEEERRRLRLVAAPTSPEDLVGDPVVAT